MKKIILSLGILLFGFGAAAQTAKVPIQTDRPDQTESPSTTPPKYWQIEMGGMFQSDKVGKTNEDYFVSPTILTKYGISKNFEFRLITELATMGNRKNNYNSYQTGINPVVIGMKVNIAKENRRKFIPKTSLVGHLGLGGLASKNFETKYSFPQFRFLMEHTLTNKTSLSYNLGADLYGSTAELSGIYTVALARDLGGDFGFFVELYGFIPEYSDWDHRFDAGATYLLNHDFQFDVSGGFGLTESAPDYFVSAGLSFRFH